MSVTESSSDHSRIQSVLRDDSCDCAGGVEIGEDANGVEGTEGVWDEG